jgi:hypothetical protein
MAEYKDILKEIESAIEKFNKGIPSAQKGMYDDITEQLRRLDLKDGRIKATVGNLRVVNSIKNKLTKLILTDDYLDNVKEFAQSFNEITKLQNTYWKAVESSFKPGPLLKEMRMQAIADTVGKLTEAGIGANISEQITDVLRTNITSGGSYKSLEGQLRELLIDTDKSQGILTRYAKQITTDSVNQYSRQYSQTVASGIGFEWFAYQGSEIVTSRPFCQSMVEERRYFHVSEIPALLKATDMYYKDNKDGQRKKVPVNQRTGLPNGFYENTTVENFLIYLGGYSCGHQARGVSEKLVPIEVKDRVYNTAAYQRWKSQN